jgi:hypothetical protein
MLWKQVKDCVAFAKKGNEPILESTAVRIVIKILDNTQVFPLDMHNWQQKSDADQASFLELKKHFIRANIVRAQKSTSKSAGYAGAAIDSKPKPKPTDSQSTQTVGNLKYCYTHGLNHTLLGKDCTNPCETHDITACVDNMKGGNDRIHCQKGEKQVHPPPYRQPPKGNKRARKEAAKGDSNKAKKEEDKKTEKVDE